MSIKRHLAFASAFLVFPFETLADQQPFSAHNLNLGFTVTQPVKTVNLDETIEEELLVIGVNDQHERVFSVVALQEQKFVVTDTVKLPSSYFAYDVGDKSADGLQSIYFLAKDHVAEYLPRHTQQADKLIKVQDVSSIYLADSSPNIVLKDFAKDLNQDKVDDFVLSHFEHTNLYLSHCCGARHLTQLPISAKVDMRQSQVSYEDPTLFFHDMTADNKQDVVYVSQGQISVYAQLEEGKFSTGAQQIAISEQIYGVNWWDLKTPDGESQDQSNLSHKVVEKIQDVNGDKVPDLITRFTRSSGVLDRKNDYEFYFGKEEKGHLVFATTPDTVVRHDDTLSNLSLVDLNQDDKIEVLVSSFDIGVSEVIAALLAGSIDQDVLIYALDDNAKYGEKPLVSGEVQINFSLSKGQSGNPLIVVADVNGDKNKDLIFSDGDDKIAITMATPGDKRPYSRSKIKYTVQLPKNAEQIKETDINGDGKADLVMHFGRLDSAGLDKTLTVLLAN